MKIVEQTNKGDSHGCLRLLQAAEIGDVGTVRAALIAGANPNARDVLSGYTALYLATTGGYKDVVLRLIDAGADVNDHQNDSNSSALGTASVAGRGEVVRMLLRHGARLSWNESRKEFYDELRALGETRIARILEEELGKRKGRAPTVYVLAGPNGAGKTTFASEFLPKFVRCREFLNADLIAAGLAPFAPETQNVRAGRLLLERIRELAAQRADFGFETTLSGRTYVKLLRDMKADGYRVELFFLLLPGAETAIARVQNRVRQGGHYVPPEDVRRRYAAGIRNMFLLYRPLVDGWSVYDAVPMPPVLIATNRRSRKPIKQSELFGRIESQTMGRNEKDR